MSQTGLAAFDLITIKVSLVRDSWVKSGISLISFLVLVPNVIDRWHCLVSICSKAQLTMNQNSLFLPFILFTCWNVRKRSFEIIMLFWDFLLYEAVQHPLYVTLGTITRKNAKEISKFTHSFPTNIILIAITVCLLSHF